jgi:hypothetical protein
MALAVVRSLRSPQRLATPQETEHVHDDHIEQA